MGGKVDIERSVNIFVGLQVGVLISVGPAEVLTKLQLLGAIKG